MEQPYGKLIEPFQNMRMECSSALMGQKEAADIKK